VRTLLVLFESRLVEWCITTTMHDSRKLILYIFRGKALTRRASC